jgi:hypothetical protein
MAMAYMFGSNFGAWPDNPGIMTVFTSPGIPGTLTFSMQNWAGGPAALNAVISGVSASTQGNYQFLLTLRDYIYVYLFGERMGDVVVSGIAGLTCAGGIHGLNAAMGYYNSYRIALTGTPVAIAFGAFSTWAFLVGGSFNYMNPKTRLASFQLKFKTIPQ